jgi:transposase-like protein
MPRVFLKGRKVTIHFHKRRHETFKKEDFSKASGVAHKRLCPNCGSPEFKVLESFWNLFLGQRSRCSDCGFVFKKPFTEKEYRKSGKFDRRRK